ncbi:MAG: hypothetical protein K2J99_12940 [Lachnospiraceae bacterium]|nr:hypothetical protein [Lachnospiraceae bacterium]
MKRIDEIFANYFRGHKETVISKVQGKLLQYYEKMKEEQQQIRQDKQQKRKTSSFCLHNG